MPSLLVLLPPSLLLVLALIDGAKAASCTHARSLDFGGQDACSIAHNVASRCDGLLIKLVDHPGPKPYPFPGQNADIDGSVVPASACTCNTMAYNLISGCAFCQIADPQANPQLYRHPADVWANACTTGGFPLDSSTPFDDSIVPAWARAPGNFDGPKALQSVPTNTTSLAGDAPTSSSSETLVTTSPTSSTTSADANSTPSSIPVGAIVGIVVAVVAVAALAIIAFFVWRRVNKRKIAPSSEFMQYSRAPVTSLDDEAPYDPPPAFTPGQFQDPIFEKGIAIAGANASISASSPSTAGGLGRSPPSLETSPLNVEPTGAGWLVKEEEIGPAR